MTPGPQALTDDEVGILLAAATHAPSMHNTQPWRFEVNGSTVDVLLDAERALPAEDPAERMIRIGLGAAAFNVRVAAAVLGHDTTYATGPDPSRPDIAARMFLAERRPTTATALSSLYGELLRRHTYRGPMTEHDLSPHVRDRLDDAAHSEGGELHWLDHAQCVLLGGILRKADQLDLADEGRVHERLRWIGGDRNRDGVPAGALGPVAVRRSAVRDLAAGFDSAHRSQAVFETRPVVAVLTSNGDDGHAWLRSGQALQRTLLTATSYDVAASFLNQALEHPVQRLKIRELTGGHRWPQMILRIGHPAHATGCTPRRDWHETLHPSN
ncbi:Acg family FMN-binding oxidoreductase [Kribbella lupini]|uniref:Nitroreductase n=1 Tax=Kribbella lupini TaxID=291602 RepID=A0ABN2AL71_9ACTN